MMEWCPNPLPSRSVKIGADERTGWSSDRPRKSGGPDRPADVSVRGRVLKPSDRMRTPRGASSSSCPAPSPPATLVERTVEEKGAVLSLDKVRALIAGRVPDDQLDAKAAELLDAAINKRLQAGASVSSPPRRPTPTSASATSGWPRRSAARAT